jgi:hypothetical protein
MNKEKPIRVFGLSWRPSAAWPALTIELRVRAHGPWSPQHRTALVSI